MRRGTSQGGAAASARSRIRPISVAVPVYKGGSYLDDAVNSVRTQTREAAELVLSVDSDVAIPAETLSAADRIVRNSPPSGIGRNWNNAVAAAQAPYVLLLHEDDALNERFVEQVEAAIEQHPDAAAFCTLVTELDSDSHEGMSFKMLIKEFIRRGFLPRGRTAVSGSRGLASLLMGQWIYCPSVVYRVGSLPPGPFSVQRNMVLDLELLLELLLAGGTIRLIPERLFFYRVHAESATSSHERTARRFVEERDLFRQYSADRRLSLPLRALCVIRPVVRAHASLALLRGCASRSLDRDRLVTLLHCCVGR